MALLAGVLMPLAFSPFHYYPIAILSLVVLFLSWHQADARTAAWRGFIFGVGLFGVGVSWVYVAIHIFGQASPLLAGLLTSLFVVILASYLAGLGWLVKKLSPGDTLSVADYLLLLPVAWLGFEWFKAWAFTGFPWLELGVSQITGPLGGYVPLIGVIGASFLVALSAGLMAVCLRYRRWLALLPIIGIWTVGHYLMPVEWTSETGEPFKATIVQGNVPQDIKWDKEQILKTMALYQAKTAENWDSDLVVWPENAITAFYHQAKAFFLDPLAEQAEQNDTEILLGLPIYEHETKRYYNGMMSLGQAQGFYYKRHLVPFGDYIPFEWLRGLIAFFDLPMSSFAPGSDGQPLLNVLGHKVGLSVCYEDTFSKEVLDTVPEASFLVNATNNAWYGDSFAPHQHLQISQSRALETGRPIIRATTNGVSAFIDHHGRLQATTAQFEQAVLTQQVQPRMGATPYVRWQQRPILGLALFMLLVWAYYRHHYFKS